MTTAGRELWRTSLKASTNSGFESPAPLITGGEVLAAQDGTITALDEQTGHVRWTWKGGKQVYDMWLDGDLLVVLTDQVGPAAAVAAVNIQDGHEMWRRGVPHGGMLGNIVDTGSGNLAWVRGDGAVQVLRMADGKLLWSAAGARSPALIAAAGRILFGATGHVTAYNESTGVRVWTIAEAAPEPALTSIGKHVLLSSSTSGGNSPTAITALDPATGASLWTFDNGASQFILGGDGARILITPAFGQLALLDANNGQQLWQQAAPVPSIDTAPLISPDRIVDGEGGLPNSPKTSLVARSPKTGQVMWATPVTGGLIGRQPLLAVDSLVIAQIPPQQHDTKAEVSAYQGSSGRQIWSVPVPTDFQAPTSVHGTTLVVQSADLATSCAYG